MTVLYDIALEIKRLFRRLQIWKDLSEVVYLVEIFNAMRKVAIDMNVYKQQLWGEGPARINGILVCMAVALLI